MALARATLTGTVQNEPEKRFTNNNSAVTNLTILVAGVGREAAYEVRVACWRNLAESVAEQVHKGDMITVEGRLQVNQYEAAGGTTRRMYEIDASNVYLGSLQGLAPAFDGQSNAAAGGGNTGNKGFGNNAQQPAYQASPAQQQPAYAAVPGVASQGMGGFSGSDEFLTEDDIPF